MVLLYPISSKMAKVELPIYPVEKINLAAMGLSVMQRNEIQASERTAAHPVELPYEKVAVLVPCYNEEITVAKVVADFKQALPGAGVFVFDNNSTDRTAEVARQAGAIVVHATRQGKGNVVRQMFEEVDADVYVMVDGDDTYPASAAPK